MGKWERGTLIEHLLCSEHSSKCVSCIGSLIPQEKMKLVHKSARAHALPMLGIINIRERFITETISPFVWPDADLYRCSGSVCFYSQLWSGKKQGKTQVAGFMGRENESVCLKGLEFCYQFLLWFATPGLLAQQSKHPWKRVPASVLLSTLFLWPRSTSIGLACPSGKIKWSFVLS